MRNKKTIMIGILCALVCVMAVGYAALAQQLNINGRASIDSTWKVEITNIKEKDVVGNATSKEIPSFTATTANFNVGLIQPGDAITYEIEVTNGGTLDAVLENISVTMDENNAITYTTSGLQKGEKLAKNGGKNYLTIKVEYNPEVTSQPTNTAKDITVTLNYIQDLGTSNEPSITYDTYSIGDVVTFAGSNWYVIKNSSSEEDYVTLMKEKVLTNAELGDYAANYTVTCDYPMMTGGIHGCTTIGETITLPYGTMSYYWSDTCHYSGSYGYTGDDWSGCEGHNDYEGSKVKEFLEGTYINTLGETNLKEVDGYKVRLITKEELQTNLGYATEMTGSYYEYSATNTPSWVYQNFGENQNNVYGYCTMTPRSENSFGVWRVSGTGNLDYGSVYSGDGVRPVINLLKSNI